MDVTAVRYDRDSELRLLGLRLPAKISQTIVRVYDMDIRTHHDWPSQMNENLLISSVKTRVTGVMGVYDIMCIIKYLKRYF